MNIKAEKEAFWEALDHCFQKSKFKTRKELSNESGIALSTLSEQFNRLKQCRQNTQEKIASAFGYNLRDFLETGNQILEKQRIRKTKKQQILPSVQRAAEKVEKEAFWEALDYCFQKSEFETQFELAKKSGVAHYTLSEQFNRIKACKKETQEKIARALGYSLSDFLKVGNKILQKQETGQTNNHTVLPKMPEKNSEQDPGIIQLLNMAQYVLIYGAQEIGAELRKNIISAHEAVWK